MLLSLLPLAGWAAIDITNFTVNLTTVSYVYSGGTPSITTLTVVNPANNAEVQAQCDLVYYNKAGQEITAAEVKNVGTYKVGARAKSTQDAYSGTTSTAIEFNITPFALTVQYKKNATTDPAATVQLDAINYGEAMPVVDKDLLVVTGWKGTDNADGNLLVKTGFTATQTSTNANADTNGTALDAEHPDYTYTLGGLSAGDNYTFTYPTIKLKIKQVALAATPAEVTDETRSYFTYAVNKSGANAYIYNSKAQVPTYTVKYIDAQGIEHSLVETTAEGPANVKQFTVAYKNSADGNTYSETYATTRANVKNAGWYKGKITAEATSNFSGSYELPEADFEYQIAKKPVTIWVENMNGKVYDGEAIPVTLLEDNSDIVVTGATIQAPGIETADEELKANLKAHFATAAYNAVTPSGYPVVYSANAVPKNAGEYILKAYTVGDGLGDNYDVTEAFIEVGVYEITQRPVTVTALDQTFTYNGKKQNLTTTITYTGENPTVAFSAVEGNANSGVVGTEQETVATLFTIGKNGTYDIQNVTNSAYTNGIKVTPKSDTKNYSIVPVSGNVIVNNQKVVIVGPTFSREYGYQLAAADLTPVLTANISLSGTPTYIITNSAGDEFHVGDYLPVDEDNYTVDIDPTSFTLPANYEVGRIETGKITITTKALKFTVKNQTLPKDAEATALVQGENYVTIDGLKSSEKVLFNIIAGTGFSTATVSTDTDGDGVIDPVANAISVKLYTAAEIAAMVTAETLTQAQADTYSNKNYTLADGDITPGKLYVVAENTIVLNRDEVNLADFINSNKSTNAEDLKTVTFSDRPMYAETWQAYVLPFAVTPAKLCAGGLGYVIVNTLKAASTPSSVKFGYTMQEIPAYTPFIMKTADAKNMSDLTLSVVLEAVPTTIVAQNTNKDVNFYGILAKKAGPFAANEYVMYNETGENNKWKNEYQGNLSAMGAYLSLPEGTPAPIITVEDENGNTTVISAISADGRFVEADGWYTLNGVKLQGVPTQKGIYIRNGKKIVVK